MAVCPAGILIPPLTAGDIRQGGYFYSARSNYYFDCVTRNKRVTRHVATQRLASDVAMGARRIVCVRRCPALPSLGELFGAHRQRLVACFQINKNVISMSENRRRSFLALCARLSFSHTLSCKGGRVGDGRVPRGHPYSSANGGGYPAGWLFL